MNPQSSVTDHASRSTVRSYNLGRPFPAGIEEGRKGPLPAPELPPVPLKPGGTGDGKKMLPMM